MGRPTAAFFPIREVDGKVRYEEKHSRRRTNKGDEGSEQRCGAAGELGQNGKPCTVGFLELAASTMDCVLHRERVSLASLSFGHQAVL